MKRIAKQPDEGTLEGKPHVWQQDQWSSTVEMTCKVCGVTWDPMSKGTLNHEYVDAMGRRISSLVELPCPVFIGDTNGAVAETKYRVRMVKDKVESMEERLQRLEDENTNLKRTLIEHQENVKQQMTEWLIGVMQQAKGKMLEDRGILDNIIDAVYEKVEVSKDTSGDKD